MKKIGFIIALVTILISCQSQIKERPESTNTKVITDTKEDVFTVKYGLKFIKPKTWKMVDEDIKSINLKGEAMSLETTYIDMQDNAKISLKLHPGERGNSLYKSFKNDTNSNFKPIPVGNKQGLQKIEHLSTNGKGKSLNTPITRIITSVLVSEGEVTITFDTTSKNAIKSFNNFLSSITFN